MKIYTYIKCAIIAVLLGSTISCTKSFLEIEPKQRTNASESIIDIASLEASINGVYGVLQNEYYYGRTFIVIPELMSDNGMISIVNSARYTNINANTTVSSDTYITGLWNTLYQMVINTNFIIEKAPALVLPEDKINEGKEKLAEAYALRALGYFDLVRSFAQPFNYTPGATHPGVPLVTHSGMDASDIKKPGRNTVGEVYAQIIEDLQKSIELFKIRSTNTSTRFTLYGAKALLAKVYLYKEDWINAEKEATDVITQGNYQLLSNADLVTTFKTKLNAETIFEIANNTADNGGTTSLAYFYSQLGYGDIIGTEDLYKAYSATDVRLKFIAKSRRNRVGGEEPAYIISKYANITNYEENTKVLRLAEVYLIRAEARAKQPGKEGLSQDDLLLIAKRGDLNAIRSTSTGDELVGVVLKERRKELAFEGNQLFDLNRSKKNWTKFRSGATAISYTNQSNRTIYPIPRRELNLNLNIKQNPGF